MEFRITRTGYKEIEANSEDEAIEAIKQEDEASWEYDEEIVEVK